MSKRTGFLLCAVLFPIAFALLFMPAWEQYVPEWFDKAFVLSFAVLNIGLGVWAIKKEG